MPAFRIPNRLRTVPAAQRLSVLGISAAAGAATLALSLAPGADTDGSRTVAADSAASSVLADEPAKGSGATSQDRAVHQWAADEVRRAADADKRTGQDEKAAKDEERQAGREAAAGRGGSTQAKASRSNDRTARSVAAPSYANNLDGWIRQSLAIMKSHGIPGSYDGIHRNIIRESGGDPQALNGWDINAQNGTPSIGLLQVIQPTFDAYHVSGTARSLYDPVANIVAACNYAADRYGSIDNVDGAY